MKLSGFSIGHSENVTFSLKSGRLLAAGAPGMGRESVQREFVEKQRRKCPDRIVVNVSLVQSHGEQLQGLNCPRTIELEVGFRSPP